MNAGNVEYSFATSPSKEWVATFKRIFLGSILLFVIIEVIFTIETSWKNTNDALTNPTMDQATDYDDNYNLVSPYFPDALLEGRSSHSIRTHLKDTFQSYLDSDCMAQWPDVINCSNWIEDSEYGLRYLLTNSIPTIQTEPYCPWGPGKGYCFPSGGTDCPQFEGMVCPAQAGRNGTNGDVVVPQIFMYRFEINPDPTLAIKPLSMYDNNSAIWVYEHTLKELQYMTPDPPPVNAAVIAAHITGQNIKGPVEAEGYNVDIAGLEFNCGGHITPPVALGPLWHFHKASLCLDDTETVPTEHSELQAYANDGFGIYGVYDNNGLTPVLDECNGHFGTIPGAIGADGEAKVMYHYHMRDETYTGKEHYEPYWIGCLGPSKSRCNTTKEDPQSGGHWCGSGCGYEICVQPGTSTDSLNGYLSQFDPSGTWLDEFTVNPY